MAEGSLHIVVFPWLAFGHMIPFLELSKSLAKRGHHISFLSTPRNILRLPLIDFIPIHLPPSNELPDNAEATIDLLPADVEHLKKAYDGLHQPMAKFLEQASPRPDWIIQEYFIPHWVSPIAAELHIPCAMLNLFPAYFNAFIYGPDGVGMRRSAEQLVVAPEWIPFPTAAAYRPFEARQLHYLLQDDSSGRVVRGLPFRSGRPTVQVHGSTRLHGMGSTTVLRTIWELFNKPVVPVGLLPPPVDEGGEKMAHTTRTDILRWLDERAPRSVVYVSLGSEATLSSELVHELALGLELSGLSFLWALRRPAGMPKEVELLPEGFENRIAGGNGLVAMDWARSSS